CATRGSGSAWSYPEYYFDSW
nr:immunoglobulin heavy chain junction region [Macaca mulatta]MOV47916.1 immunoglobulin heavy chain junction region [Macaca mulatta]MOV48007.1 immunoglobulin heavy chain junction region [Macaca mulatta]MOV48014.1 immunoglobulin heavy chain junction region [Macaca mulatta]MOV48079.1 immunoglobulin heavy chain junction region [Macaca mulatta]